jgi:ADP-dependent NAD(P)H-hydrate dehydratase / NAD(P)H-hydrate epimerase
VIPVLTPEQMAAVDEAAPESVDELIARAGAATARVAVEMLGGTYGRRVAVLVGKGNNGADGRDAARRLQRRGVRCRLYELGELPRRLSDIDLVVDAVLGPSPRPGYRAPRVSTGIPVLAVDVPSGLDGLTGRAGDDAQQATRTVTFAALKPGLLLDSGRRLAGEVSVADIGLDTSNARAGLMTDGDAVRLLPTRPHDAHKWKSAVWVIGGGPGMYGAPRLTAMAAQRSGAGYVRMSSPGADFDSNAPTEAVGVSLPGRAWAKEVVSNLDRIAALAVGPGLDPDTLDRDSFAEVLVGAQVPIVVDGGGLVALGALPRRVLAGRRAATVLTPHDGELRHLLDRDAGDDRTATARDLAVSTCATVVLKGPTTVIADPSGIVRYVTSGDERLATAGTGDVLTGIVAALLAQGLAPLDAAAVGAHLHGLAGTVGSARGVVAGDLPDLLPLVFDQI